MEMIIVKHSAMEFMYQFWILHKEELFMQET